MMTMLTEYESMTGHGVRGVRLAEPIAVSPKPTEEDEEPMRLEERKDAPAMLQL